MDEKNFIAIVLLAAGTLLVKYGINLRDCTKCFVSESEIITKITSFFFGFMFILAGYKSTGSINISIVTIFITLFLYWHIKKYIKPRFSQGR